MIPKIRLLSQSIFFAFSLCVFYGLISHRGLIHCYHSLHVFPALSSLAWFLLPSCVLAVLIALGLPLFFGRLYCSYLCPAGFMQDLVFRFYRAVKIRANPLGETSVLRFFVFGAAIVFLATRSPLYHFVDHFSNLERVYGLPLTFLGRSPFGTASVIAIVFLCILLLVPLRVPRWFCNAVCPSGTLFMLLQKKSLWQLRVSDQCVECGFCLPACPALCLDQGRLDYRLCIHCFECVPACPKDAVKFSFRWPWSRRKPTVQKQPGEGGIEGRREWLIGATTFAAGIFFARFARAKPGTIVSPRSKPVVPPGGKSVDAFLARCVGCHACVAACPTEVLTPKDLGRSASGLARVVMDYERAYCAYDCNACLGVCPTSAISYFPLETKKRIKIGCSALDKSRCIPYSKGRDCGACHEVCPTGAIDMKPYRPTEGNETVRAPVLDDSYCIGCGACQFVCPTKPQKAIRVETKSMHSFAADPRKLASAKTTDKPVAGFPF